jgi:hypothetical protein
MSRGGRRVSGSMRLSADGLFYWDGTQWVSALSRDGRYRWDGTGWVPLQQPPPVFAPQPVYAPMPAPPRSARTPTSWTRPLQWAVGGMAAAVAVWYLALPFWLAGPITDYLRRTTAATPGGPDASQLSAVTVVILGATSIVLIAIAVVVAIGAARRWTWMFYVVLVLLGFAILELPPAVANATGITPQVVPMTGPLLASQWVTAGFGVVSIGLFAWMMVAALRRGPWAMRKGSVAQ